ncbi:GAF domain-containing protein [Allorhizobium sp. BGMRC 0089]|uniref:helix-turn-helix domain-containing protein n=1 Tax=Allorhizobium sonneratiae TaxID=2934936 RepID=UPI0020340398|nr:helix-turn-helix domain-containing protein [Allorhizobium sonneratiae]MCM2291225.1 GAF domain-containing protein [Allorhizobium sonneratiae]
MNIATTHADKVYSTAMAASKAASSPLAASWRRCLDLYRLDPGQPSQPEGVDAPAFREARERMGHLIAISAEEMDRLFHVAGRSGCCLVLADRNGIVLERRSMAGDDKDFHAHGLGLQRVWSEASVGTNGIGTALADERPVVIERDQHFLSANGALTCATAPIRDHRGQVMAALDISTCRRDINDMAVTMLAQAIRDAAQRVEIALFRAAFSGARIVMAGPSASSAALLAVDGDDLVLGATRAARLSLGIDDKRIALGLPAADALKEQDASAEDLREAERSALRRALSRTGGNVSQAAQLLGISRATIHRKLKRFGLH